MRESCTSGSMSGVQERSRQGRRILRHRTGETLTRK